MAEVSPANVTVEEEEEVVYSSPKREKSPPARQSCMCARNLCVCVGNVYVHILLAQSPRPDDGSDTDSDPEAQSVRTPLLEPPPSVVPAQTRNLRTYDKMFTKEQLQPEEEIPLGGTADTIVQHP